MATKAYQLRVSGRSFSEIAEMLQLPDRTEAFQLLTQRFEYDAAFLGRQERKDILSMELLRLDALQAAVWDSAMMGDPKSVDSALKVIQTRARITGIEQVDPVVNKNLVLVMGEKEQDYIDQLKAISDD